MDFDTLFPSPIYLNLGKRQDRRVAFEFHIAERELSAKRFPAVNADTVRRDHGFENTGRYAHAISTRMAIREALKKDENFFMFEDDAVIRADFKEVLAEVKLPDDWGLFYLGCQHMERPQVVDRELVRVTRALDTHAWGCRREYLEELYQHLSHPSKYEDGYYPAADLTLSELHRSIPTYSLFPNLAWQAEEHSDLAGGTYSNYHPSGPQHCNPQYIQGLAAPALAGLKFDPLEQQPFEANDSSNVAFLFLTRGEHNHPEIWSDYWNGSQAHSVYGHTADQGELTTGGWLEESQIGERVDETAWGHISLVRAQLAMLREAFHDPENGHFIFLSDSCVPVKPLAELKRLFSLDRRSRFVTKRIEHPDIIETGMALRAEEAPRVPGGYWRFHTQWVTLNREAASVVLEYDFTKLFENAFAPDESYFGTVLSLWGFDIAQKVAQHDTTWVRWAKKGNPHPIEYEAVDTTLAGDLVSGGCYFARKLASKSGFEKLGLHLRPKAGAR